MKHKTHDPRARRRAQCHGARLLDALEPRLLLTTYYITPGNLIQPVINAAASGDTIHIAAGHYVEQLTINGKDLTLTGDGTGSTFIDAPASLATSFSTSAANKAVVTFQNAANGNISNLTIDGLSHGTGNARFIGLAYRNAGGVASLINVIGITDSPADTLQSGVGIYAFDDNGTPNAVTLLNCSVSSYQKAGASLNGANLIANVLNSTFIGAGPDALVAQVGVQISFGAAGTISGNKISAHQYAGTQNAQGDAILVTQAGGLVSILGNDAQHNDGAVVADTPAAVAQNTLSNNSFGIELFGPQAGSSISNNFIQHNSQYGIYLDAALNNPLPIHNNYISGNGQYGLINASGSTVEAENNWWGQPTGANTPGADTSFGYANVTPALLNDAGGSGATGAQPTPPVVGRYVFYNDSAFDNNDPAANANDDGAIAPDKAALLPGQTASFANYTSYVNGINGIMIDVLNFAHPGQVNATDFRFRTGTSNDPAAWADAPAPAAVFVRSGAGAGGADRVDIVWDNASAVKGAWLQVTLKADGHTGLPADDVFYFGNAIGDTGNSASDAYVSAIDELAARFAGADLTGVTGPQAMENVFDFNRDRHVNMADQTIAGSHYTTFLNALPLISVPQFLPLALTAAPDTAAPLPAPADAPAPPQHLAPEIAIPLPAVAPATTHAAAHFPSRIFHAAPAHARKKHTLLTLDGTSR